MKVEIVYDSQSFPVYDSLIIGRELLSIQDLAYTFHLNFNIFRISRKQVQMTVSDNQVFITRLGINPCQLNGEDLALDESVSVKDGDIVTLLKDTFPFTIKITNTTSPMESNSIENIKDVSTLELIQREWTPESDLIPNFNFNSSKLSTLEQEGSTSKALSTTKNTSSLDNRKRGLKNVPKNVKKAKVQSPSKVKKQDNISQFESQLESQKESHKSRIMCSSESDSQEE